MKLYRVTWSNHTAWVEGRNAAHAAEEATRRYNIDPETLTATPVSVY